VIVPCFNESDRLDINAFGAFTDANADAHFLFVDDGSTDRTRAMLDQFVASRPDRLRVLSLAANAGKAEAVRRGGNSLAQWMPFGHAGYIDADLSSPLDTIRQLQAAIEREPRYEFALGSRVALLGRTIRRNALRHYLGRVFATATSLMLRLPVYDTQCGAKFFRTTLIPEIFSEPFLTRWFFDVEIIFRLLKSRGPEAGASLLVEVPVLEWIEKGGSKIKATEFLQTPIQLFRIWRHYR
jgi:glycosyltransferase involved in cell wall biosynthesis